MTAPTPQPDVLAVLDELDALHGNGLAGPWDASAPFATGGQVWIELHGAGGYVPGIVGNSADAALIVAAVNRLPELTAALRAVHALAEPWIRYPQSLEERQRNRYGAGMQDCAEAICDILAALTTDPSGETP